MAAQPGKYKRVNKDDLRAMLDGGKWSKGNEKIILDARDALIMLALTKQKDVIVDDTNFEAKHLDRFKEIAEYMSKSLETHVEVVVKDFDVKVEECIARDLKRPQSVGEGVIRGMYERYVKPKPEAVVQNPDLPDAYQYDLDGTLALYDNPHNLKSINYEREFIYDRVNYPVYDQLRMQQKAGYKIIILSGRNGEFEAVTKEWLGKHGIHPDLFIMRSVDDRRKDFEVKEEMFRKYVLPKYHVQAIYDDRTQVVNLWRELGLTCFQVAPGDF